MKQLRSERNRLLAETDYLALSDSTLTDAMKTHKIRDITDNATSLDDVTWLLNHEPSKYSRGQVSVSQLKFFCR